MLMGVASVCPSQVAMFTEDVSFLTCVASTSTETLVVGELTNQIRDRIIVFIYELCNLQTPFCSS